MANRPPFKVVKLDGRFTGRQFFTYALDYRFGGFGARVEPYLMHRAWFWETFGPSGEFHLWQKAVSYQDNISRCWAWDSNYDQRRIYVQDDETLSPFLLTFG